MQENSSILEDTNTVNSWTVLESRTIFLAVVLVSAIFLILRSLLFSPAPPNRPYILNGTSDQAILESLRWYTENSVGSLKLDNNRCIVEKDLKQVLCKNSLVLMKPAKSLWTVAHLKMEKENWPNIWLTKAYDNEVSLEFALHSLEPIKVLSQKERRTVLGTELIVEVEFKKISLTPVSKKILDSSEIKNLEEENNTNFNGSIAFLPNPYGYYLPIFPLP